MVCSFILRIWVCYESNVAFREWVGKYFPLLGFSGLFCVDLSVLCCSLVKPSGPRIFLLEGLKIHIQFLEKICGYIGYSFPLEFYSLFLF